MRQSDRQIKLALVQYPIVEKQSGESLLKVHRDFFEQAKAAHVDLLIFPELVCLDMVDFTQPLDPQWKYLSTFHREKYLPEMQKMAAEFSLDVLTGSFPDHQANNVVNTCWFLEQDQPPRRIDKAFVTPEEHYEYRWSSGKSITTLNYRGLRTAILVCHDSEFTACSNLLTEFQPEFLIVPSMTTDRWGLNRVRWSTQARCVEHQCLAVITATVETSTTRGEYTGQAAMICPQNPVLGQDPVLGKWNESDLLIVELPTENLKKSRLDPKQVYPARDQLARKDKITLC